jgi:hypothetical protein
MENNNIVKLISYVIVYDKKDLIDMLNKNGVVVNADNLTTNELTKATLDGLTSSKKFNDDFVNHLKNKVKNYGYSNDDGNSTTSSFMSSYGGLVTAGIPALTNLFTLNTNTKNLQGQINAENLKNQTSLEIAKTQLEIAKVNADAAKNAINNATTPSGNKTLYIALGIGGVLVLGVVIFAVTRK